MSDKPKNGLESWECGPDDLTMTCDDFRVEIARNGHAVPWSKNAPIRRYFMPLMDGTAYILRLDTDARFVVAVRVFAHWAEDANEPEPFLALEAERDPGFLEDQLKALRGQRVHLAFRKRPR